MFMIHLLLNSMFNPIRFFYFRNTFIFIKLDLIVIVCNYKHQPIACQKSIYQQL